MIFVVSGTALVLDFKTENGSVNLFMFHIEFYDISGDNDCLVDSASVFHSP